MKCIYCNKEINVCDKKSYRLCGLDGDFIHTNCTEKFHKQQDIINNMTDNQFINYITGKTEIAVE